VSWSKFTQAGSSAIVVIAAINDVYQFAGTHWPYVKTLYKIVKEIVVIVASLSRPGRRSGGGVRRRREQVERTMVDLRRDCRAAIRYGYVSDEEARDMHTDFNLWFSQLPPNVRRDIYKRILAQKFTVASTTENGKGTKKRKVKRFVIGVLLLFLKFHTLSPPEFWP